MTTVLIMNFDPQKFFIGVVDFFSIIMPGALLAYLAKDHVGGLLPMMQPYPLVGPERWAVFLFASYLLGHFVFLFGSFVDEWVYDPLRRCTDLGQIRRLAKGTSLSNRVARDLANSSWLFGPNADAAVIQAQRIKARALHALGAQNAINAFQWCKARLSQENPQGFVAVQRFEADSKFFRSLMVVLAIFVIILFREQHVIGTLACLVGLILALWRYIDERFKSTQYAYYFVITLEGQKGAAATRSPRDDKLTHAGGIVYEKIGDSIRYLLVQAKKDSKQWVLPKGHIEAGESPRETAVRETKEETGQWARVIGWVEDRHFDKGKSNEALVRFFCMEAVQPHREKRHLSSTTTPETSESGAEEEKPWRTEGRQTRWLSLAVANKQATFKETRELLEEAERAIRSAK